MSDLRLNQKSIRISDSVYNYINSFDGENFNDKLNNIFLFFMSEEKSKRAQIDSLDKDIKLKEKQYDELCCFVYSLQNLERSIARFETDFKRYQADLNKLFGGDFDE